MSGTQARIDARADANRMQAVKGFAIPRLIAYKYKRLKPLSDNPATLAGFDAGAWAMGTVIVELLRTARPTDDPERLDAIAEVARVIELFAQEASKAEL